MLEFSLRFTIADDTSTDEALIAGFPHDLRAIADQVAQTWPGKALDASLEAGGRLARPACLEVDLAHGGCAVVEVRQVKSTTGDRLPNGVANGQGHGARHSSAGRGSPEPDLDDILASLVSSERLEALTHEAAFLASLGRTVEVLSAADPNQARKAVRIMRSFAGHFVDLVAKDRSGYWVRLSEAPTADPYYVCAEFNHAGAVSRVPLPQILPEAAEGRRSFTISPEFAQVVTLLEHTIPAELEAVRMAGRDYLARRQDWLSRGRYTK